MYGKGISREGSLLDVGCRPRHREEVGCVVHLRGRAARPGPREREGVPRREPRPHGGDQRQDPSGGRHRRRARGRGRRESTSPTTSRWTSRGSRYRAPRTIAVVPAMAHIVSTAGRNHCRSTRWWKCRLAQIPASIAGNRATAKSARPPGDLAGQRVADHRERGAHCEEHTEGGAHGRAAGGAGRAALPEGRRRRLRFRSHCRRTPRSPADAAPTWIGGVTTLNTTPSSVTAPTMIARSSLLGVGHDRQSDEGPGERARQEPGERPTVEGVVLAAGRHRADRPGHQHERHRHCLGDHECDERRGEEIEPEADGALHDRSAQDHERPRRRTPPPPRPPAQATCEARLVGHSGRRRRAQRAKVRREHA